METRAETVQNDAEERALFARRAGALAERRPAVPALSTILAAADEARRAEAQRIERGRTRAATLVALVACAATFVCAQRGIAQSQRAIVTDGESSAPTHAPTHARAQTPDGELCGDTSSAYWSSSACSVASFAVPALERRDETEACVAPPASFESSASLSLCSVGRP
jgi:hypothetical protein